MSINELQFREWLKTYRQLYANVFDYIIKENPELLKNANTLQEATKILCETKELTNSAYNFLYPRTNENFPNIPIESEIFWHDIHCYAITQEWRGRKTPEESLSPWTEEDENKYQEEMELRSIEKSIEQYKKQFEFFHQELKNAQERLRKRKEKQNE